MICSTVLTVREPHRRHVILLQSLVQAEVFPHLRHRDFCFTEFGNVSEAVTFKALSHCKNEEIHLENAVIESNRF